jgi:hypothetical protein
MDLAIKCMQNIVPRKEQQILRIFDQFSNKKVSLHESFTIDDNCEQKFIRMARERLEEIRSLYLEQMYFFNFLKLNFLIKILVRIQGQAIELGFLQKELLMFLLMKLGSWFIF